MILAGDIGGTNTRLAMYDDPHADDPDAPLVRRDERRIRTADVDREVALREAIGAWRGHDVRAVCVGVAGPVRGHRGEGDQRVDLTNRGWTLDAADLADAAGVSRSCVLLVNDMVAHAAATVGLGASGRQTLRAGHADPRGARVLLMPGTGLGVSGLTYDELARHHRPFPGAGGHAEFAPRDDTQAHWRTSILAIKRSAGAASGRVSWEDLLSGPGLRRLYAVLASPDRPDLHAAPPAERITAAAAEGSDPIAVRVADAFVTLCAQAAGNLALQWLATGGVYVGGSILSDEGMLRRLSRPAFTHAFDATAPRRLSGVLCDLPLYRITLADSGLDGAARLAGWVLHEKPIR